MSSSYQPPVGSNREAVTALSTPGILRVIPGVDNEDIGLTRNQQELGRCFAVSNGI